MKCSNKTNDSQCKSNLTKTHNSHRRPLQFSVPFSGEDQLLDKKLFKFEISDLFVPDASASVELTRWAVEAEVEFAAAKSDWVRTLQAGV
jgi:hypothetical protein